jgi:transforming growth factor-beta-induced protein
MKNIIETAVAAGTFPTLVAALKAADLVKTLTGPGPFTVFAPSEEAFKKLPEGTVESLLKPENKAKLVSLLTYHVVSGKADAAAVTAKKEWTTVEGSPVTIDATNGAKIQNATITKTDIECTNGYIHVIDAVIMPRSMQDKKAA